MTDQNILSAKKPDTSKISNAKYFQKNMKNT